MGGVTVDYGPFGFVEKYEPGWGMWVGSGEHYGFMNQFLFHRPDGVPFSSNKRQARRRRDVGVPFPVLSTLGRCKYRKP